MRMITILKTIIVMLIVVPMEVLQVSLGDQLELSASAPNDEKKKEAY